MGRKRTEASQGTLTPPSCCPVLPALFCAGVPCPSSWLEGRYDLVLNHPDGRQLAWRGILTQSFPSCELLSLSEPQFPCPSRGGGRGASHYACHGALPGLNERALPHGEPRLSAATWGLCPGGDKSQQPRPEGRLHWHRGAKKKKKKKLKIKDPRPPCHSH